MRVKFWLTCTTRRYATAKGTGYSCFDACTHMRNASRMSAAACMRRTYHLATSRLQGTKAVLEKEKINNVTHLFHLAFAGARPPSHACLWRLLSSCMQCWLHLKLLQGPLHCAQVT